MRIRGYEIPEAWVREPTGGRHLQRDFGAGKAAVQVY